MAVNGTALAAVAGGSLFVWAGLSGRSLLAAAQAMIRGQSPASAPQANPVTGTSGTSGSGGSGGAATGNVAGGEAPVSGGSAQQLLQIAAAQHGWGSGAQWQALQNVEMAEAGFNPRAVNPSSGALGLAQALGHGNANTAGTLGNQYGGFGLTDAEARAANSGDAGEQAVWMCNYIAAVYGDPVNAWAHEQQYHWY